MRKIIRVLVIIMTVVLLISCKRAIKPSELPANIQIGNHYYTQFALQFEKGRYVTTNYRRGVLLPINSEVTLLEITNKTILVSVAPSHFELLIKNAYKHTNDDTIQAFNKLFAESKRDLKQFTKQERKQIKLGKVAKGMRKKAVLAAMGYPPQIETPSLDIDQWTYWSSRWNRFIVYFHNGRVARIQD